MNSVRTRVILVALAAIFLGATFDSEARGRSNGGSRPSYSGGTHSSSHGGHYSGGRGSSHKGGDYKNARSADRYGKHKN